MISEKRKQELWKGLHDAVVNYDEDLAVELSKAAIAEGADAYETVMNGLMLGARVEALSSFGEAYTPEEREVLIHKVKQSSLKY